MEVLQTSALDHLATSPLFLAPARSWRAVPVLLDGAEGEARTRTPLRAQRPQRCLSTNSNTSAPPEATGRSGGTRTPDLRFWSCEMDVPSRPRKFRRSRPLRVIVAATLFQTPRASYHLGPIWDHSGAAKSTVDVLSRLPLEGRQDVGICVHRQADARVTEAL